MSRREQLTTRGGSDVWTSSQRTCRGSMMGARVWLVDRQGRRIATAEAGVPRKGLGHSGVTGAKPWGPTPKRREHGMGQLALAEMLHPGGQDSR